MGEVFSILDSVETPMRDGTILRADIWLPQGEGPWPVLLQRTPYRKEDLFGAEHMSALEFRAALRKGYAVVVQDTRGRFSSDGGFDPFKHEDLDGVDTISWVRAQAFCNGQIAMFGPSYVGATQVLAAAQSPEGLVALAPQVTTARHGETWFYRGGAIELGFALLWLEGLSAEDLPRRLPQMEADDADRARALLAEAVAEPHASFARLPIIDRDRIALAPYVTDWIDNDRAEAAGDDREHLGGLAASNAAVLVICGWNDLFVEGSIELFETARARWASPTEVGDRLIIGPWSHGNLTEWQGDAWHRSGGAAGGLLSEEQLAFFDAAIKGETPASPVARYFRTGSNTWHSAPDWPLPDAVTQTYYLSGDRSLRRQSATDDWSLSYVSDTLDAVPTAGGANFLPGLFLGRSSGPKAQAAVEERSDVLVFTSPALDEDLEVTGLVEAKLWVTSSAVGSDWTVRLCEVDEAGRSIGLVDGIRRWKRRDATLGGSEPEEVSVRVGHISHLFRKGTHLRIQVASSNFPRFDRNPQSGVPSSIAREDDFVVAQQTVSGGPARGTCIMLPVVPRAYPMTPSLTAGV